MNRTTFLVISLVSTFAFTLAMGFGLGHYAQSALTPVDPKLEVLSGEYYQGDGLGYNVSIILNANGTYSSEWQGCLGSYGSGWGTWTATDSLVTLSPTTETGMMQGHLRKLEIVKAGNDTVLLDKGDWELFRIYGVDRSTCFQRRERLKF